MSWASRRRGRGRIRRSGDGGPRPPPLANRARKLTRPAPLEQLPDVPGEARRHSGATRAKAICRPRYMAGARTTRPSRLKSNSRGDGGARRDRTADLLHAMQALSQLSYGPTTEGGEGTEGAPCCQAIREGATFPSNAIHSHPGSSWCAIAISERRRCAVPHPGAPGSAAAPAAPAWRRWVAKPPCRWSPPAPVEPPCRARPRAWQRDH